MLLRALFDFDPVLRIPVRWKNKADKLLRHLCFKPAFSRDLLKNLIEALEMQINVYCMHSYLSQVQTNGPGCILFEISITQMFNVRSSGACDNKGNVKNFNNAWWDNCGQEPTCLRSEKLLTKSLRLKEV